MDHKVYDYPFRRVQLEIRTNEVSALVKQVKQKDFAKSVFEIDTIKVDAERLILCGHSFGGMTVLAASQENPDVKNVIALDPWLGILEKAI